MLVDLHAPEHSMHHSPPCRWWVARAKAEEQCHMAKLIERYDADTITLDRRHALELAAH